MIFVYSPRNADSCVPGFFCAGTQKEISRFTAYAPRGGQRKRHSPPDGKAGTQKEIRKERRQDDG